MERKFVASNVNNDDVLSWGEWTEADYPLDFAPWQGSLNCSSDGTGCSAMTRAAYNHYLAFHHCSMQAARRYASFPSAYPLWSACEVLLKVPPPPADPAPRLGRPWLTGRPELAGRVTRFSAAMVPCPNADTGS
jgi:hypothetical protein